jgi:hypothetical protein
MTKPIPIRTYGVAAPLLLAGALALVLAVMNDGSRHGWTSMLIGDLWTGMMTGLLLQARTWRVVRPSPPPDPELEAAAARLAATRALFAYVNPAPVMDALDAWVRLRWAHQAAASQEPPHADPG